jgi:hypothetical protein
MSGMGLNRWKIWRALKAMKAMKAMKATQIKIDFTTPTKQQVTRHEQTNPLCKINRASPLQ